MTKALWGPARWSVREDGERTGEDPPTQQYLGSISELPKSRYIDFILSSLSVSLVLSLSCCLA